ncbi:ras association domain-containing protein 6-like [Molothrus ater]|uniref:ras association domain-containing protein 6-like n=1 Tax=Molothrus ater TaxID=84834 RepID=UPI00174CC006|nr:ras association domain-containing protein 6-like [Molothrus ater]
MPKPDAATWAKAGKASGCPRGMTRWGEFDDLHHISGDALKSAEEQPDLEQSYPCYESHTLRSRREQELDCATLPRSSSDATAVRRRTKLPTITRTEVETHRFSINGHFYNHETSVFTPASGSETKIRINSQTRTRQVIEQLLRKFKCGQDEEEHMETFNSNQSIYIISLSSTNTLSNQHLLKTTKKLQQLCYFYQGVDRAEHTKKLINIKVLAYIQ